MPIGFLSDAERERLDGFPARLRVGRASKRLKTSRLATVPELAVLLGRRAERSRREVAGERDGRGRVGQRGAAVAPDGHRLDPLRAEDGPQAPPAGVAAVVAERRERDQPLARRPDRRDLPVGPVLGPDPGLGLARRRAPRASPAGPAVDRGLAAARAVDEDDDGLVARPGIASASTPARFAAIAKCDEESASQSRPVSGLSATTANLAEVVSGLPTSGLSAKTSAASGPSGSTPAGVSRHEPGPEPDAADEPAQVDQLAGGALQARQCESNSVGLCLRVHARHLE